MNFVKCIQIYFGIEIEESKEVKKEKKSKSFNELS